MLRLARVLRREDGQAITEFALILPILMALLLGIIQFGILFNNYVTIADNGAAAKLAAQNSAAGLNPATLNVSVTSSDWTTPGSDVNVTVTYPYSINILGWTVKAGSLTSTTRERLE